MAITAIRAPDNDTTLLAKLVPSCAKAVYVS